MLGLLQVLRAGAATVAGDGGGVGVLGAAACMLVCRRCSFYRWGGGTGVGVVFALAVASYDVSDVAFVAVIVFVVALAGGCRAVFGVGVARAQGRDGSAFSRGVFSKLLRPRRGMEIPVLKKLNVSPYQPFRRSPHPPSPSAYFSVYIYVLPNGRIRFSERPFRPTNRADDMTDSSSEVSSGDHSEESSEKDSEEESECGSDDSGEAAIATLKAVLKDKLKARAKAQGRTKEANGVGEGGGSKAVTGKGRGMRSAVSLPLFTVFFCYYNGGP